MYKSIFDNLGSGSTIPPTTTTRPVVVMDMDGNLTVLFIS